VADVGDSLDGDQLGADPVATWDAAAKAALGSFRASGVIAGTVSLSSGERPAEEYCFEMTADALVHGWDLARAIGADETLDPEIAALVYERSLPFVDELAKTGMFAPPVAVPDDAPVSTKLLAISGRSA
jgi:uncharacterized protein (TIGR03086 family)